MFPRRSRLKKASSPRTSRGGRTCLQNRQNIFMTHLNIGPSSRMPAGCSVIQILYHSYFWTSGAFNITYRAEAIITNGKDSTKFLKCHEGTSHCPYLALSQPFFIPAVQTTRLRRGSRGQKFCLNRTFIYPHLRDQQVSARNQLSTSLQPLASLLSTPFFPRQFTASYIVLSFLVATR